MHLFGINWAAVLVAAAAFFAVGFVIHLRLVDLKAWDAAKHLDGRACIWALRGSMRLRFVAAYVSLRPR